MDNPNKDDWLIVTPYINNIAAETQRYIAISALLGFNATAIQPFAWPFRIIGDLSLRSFVCTAAFHCVLSFAFQNC